MTHTTAVNLHLSQDEFLRARRKLTDQYSQKGYRPSRASLEKALELYLDHHPETKIEIKEDLTLVATGPVVFSTWEQRYRFERPDYPPPMEFSRVDGPVLICRVSELSALPEDYQGDIYLRLERWVDGTDHEQFENQHNGLRMGEVGTLIGQVREEIQADSAKLMAQTIANNYSQPQPPRMQRTRI